MVLSVAPGHSVGDPSTVLVGVGVLVPFDLETAAMLGSWAFLMTDFDVLKIIWKVFWHLVAASHTIHSGQGLRKKWYREGHLVTGGMSAKPRCRWEARHFSG